MIAIIRRARRTIIAFFLLLPSWFFAFDLPAAPAIPAHAWVIYDAQAREILAAKNLDMSIEPASLTKLMTAYLTFQVLDKGQLTLTRPLVVSNRGYHAEGSRLFLDPKQSATVDTVLKGLIVVSGNDAAVTLAEALSGDEASFADLMNQEARDLGLKKSHFTNATGLPAPEHVTTPRDLLLLSLAVISDYPQYYPYFAQRELVYNGVRQSNRNTLLFTDPDVDGLKTGHTGSAGYNLIATENKNGRRLIAVIIGAPSAKSRADSAAKLFLWARTQFVNGKIGVANRPIAEIKVYQGKDSAVSVGYLQDLYIAVPRQYKDEVRAIAHLPPYVIAPVAQGAAIGELRVKIGAHLYQRVPIIALNDVPAGGFFKRFWDSFLLLFR